MSFNPSDKGYAAAAANSTNQTVESVWATQSTTDQDLIAVISTMTPDQIEALALAFRNGFASYYQLMRQAQPLDTSGGVPKTTPELTTDSPIETDISGNPLN